MRFVYETRASTILHNLLRSAGDARPWLLPANVCPIVPLTFLKAGCPFEFVDIDEATLCIDPGQALRRLRQVPGAFGGFLFVRTYGVEDDFETFFEEIKAAGRDLILVDDRCVCRPNFEPPARGHADVLLFSTGYAKSVDVGCGGFAHAGDQVPYAPCELPYEEKDLQRLTAGYKRAITGGAPMSYENSDWLDTRRPGTPLNEYRALIESRVDESYRHKQRLNGVYREAIPASARLDDRFQSWRFHILVPEKAALIASIFDNGLFASSHYADLTPVFSAGAAPVTERLHRRVVNLFNDGYFTEEQAREVAALVREHLDSHGA